MAVGVKKKQHAVTYPQGYTAAGLHCGFKKKAGAKDLALVLSEAPARVGACFTNNRVKAWPVEYSQRILSYDRHRAILVNSGNANCMTGKQGREGLMTSVSFLAAELGIDKSEILVASTGVIGAPFEALNIVSSVPELCFSLSRTGGHAAAEAIMTTDTVAKEVGAECVVYGTRVRVGGMAKGVGMMKPNMATMLAFLTTDILISKQLLQQIIADVVEDTFNCISVDNDTSTNDSVFILANGCAKNALLFKKDKAYDVFKSTVHAVCKELSRMMVKDGEGVNRVCDIVIKGAKNRAQAKMAAAAIADSMLFKTALAGADPNWGRILAALGACEGLVCNFKQIDLFFGNVQILRKGEPVSFNRSHAKRAFSKKEVIVTVDLKSGKEGISFFTSDLTKKYIEINADYTS